VLVKVHALDGDDVGETLAPWPNIDAGDALLVAGKPWRVELVVDLADQAGPVDVLALARRDHTLDAFAAWPAGDVFSPRAPDADLRR
jgi:hypothetical protein